MKKIKAFRILVVVVIAAIGIVSCSQEENQVSGKRDSSAQRLSVSEIDRLKSEFLNIMKSEEYILFESNAKAMAIAMNGADEQHLNSKAEFEAWVKVNIGLQDLRILMRHWRCMMI